MNQDSIDHTNIFRRRFLSGLGKILAAPVFSTSLGGLAADELDLSADSVIRKQSASAPLSMVFKGNTPRQLAEWQTRFRNQLVRQLGDFSPPKIWRVQLEKSENLKKFERSALLLSAPGVPVLPVFVLKPHAPLPGRPGILALHGHGDFGYQTVAGVSGGPELAAAIQKANYDYGRQLAERGYTVVAPNMTPFGRRRGREYSDTDPCAVTFVRMQLLGQLLMGNNLRDCLWAFEYLRGLPNVNSERLGCVGLSYGGRMAMLTAALEKRVRVCVVSGALNLMQERIENRYACGAQVIPGLLKYGDVPEILSLVAPRTLLLETGTEDRLIDSEWAGRGMQRLRKAYRAAGAGKQLLRDEFKGGHRWNGNVAYPLLKQTLSDA